jgi:hypothetical protein
MASCDFFGARFSTGEANLPPKPDNENLPLLEGSVLTPAEALQWARRRKQRLCRELAKDARLWHCPEHRRTWNATIGIEKLTLWQCYGILDVS